MHMVWSCSLSADFDGSLARVGIKDRILDILSMDFTFLGCTLGVERNDFLDIRLSIKNMIRYYDEPHFYLVFIVSTLWLVKWIVGNLEISSL